MSGYGEYAWGKRNCQVYGGSYSGWAVGGGRDGQSLACSADYLDNVQSWMVYGPFSLADATAADLSFKAWVYAEAEHDWFFWGASTDGNSFRGRKSWGDSQGWREEGLDLAEPSARQLVAGPDTLIVVPEKALRHALTSPC